MKLNQISKVQLIKTREGKDAVRIVLLKSKTQAHKANLKDDYAKLQQAAINKKQQDKMTTWVKKTISKNYIVVDDEFKKCDEIKTMWLKNNN
jgi:peptidyl-prolyl cis-trans isomerase SurA